MYPIRFVRRARSDSGFLAKRTGFPYPAPVGSLLLGVAVFVMWVAPDALWPAYRSHWLFTNAITGEVRSGIPEGVRANWSFIFFRAAGCFLLVPVVEELFWRGWLSRWLIDGDDFRRVKIGAYRRLRSGWGRCCLLPSTARLGSGPDRRSRLQLVDVPHEESWPTASWSTR